MVVWVFQSLLKSRIESSIHPRWHLSISQPKTNARRTAYSFDWLTDNQTKSRIRSARKTAHQEKLDKLRMAMSSDERRANDLAQMEGASSWLTSLPFKTENYDLNKREFHDGIRLRYRWSHKYLPATCVCGKSFTPDHAMSCAKGGFIHQRHNEIRDLVGQVAPRSPMTWNWNRFFYQ